MTTDELHNRIHCWLWLHQHATHKKAHSNTVVVFADGIPFHWMSEMMVDVATLDIPPDLEGSPIAGDLRLAIQFAQSGDCDFIKHIATLLKKINSAIAHRPQYGNSISVN